MNIAHLEVLFGGSDSPRLPLHIPPVSALLLRLYPIQNPT